MAASQPSPVIPRIAASDFVARKFDYLVVGGGTAGLVVAARLSEDSTLTVGVLEAGPAGLGERTIEIPGLYGETLGTDYDWQFETVPQPGLAGRKLPWPRGKVLGGTSAINFMTWNRASREDYDAWEQLGNPGWNWDHLLPFFKRPEAFHEPTDAKCGQENKLFYDPDSLGRSGPIQVSYANEYSACHSLWHDTLHSLGVETNKAHLNGSNVGAWTNLGAVDPRSCTRSYSTSAYYLPNASRPNLFLLTDSLVERTELENQSGGWIATGVHFQHGGHAYHATATKEVILCAGSVQSPQLLELSGIGNPDILSQAGISVKFPNPNVGENLQEHIMLATIFEVDPTLSNPDDLKHDNAAAAAANKLFTESKSGPLSILPNAVCYLPFSHVVPKDVQQSSQSRAASFSHLDKQEKQIRLQRFDPAARLGQIEYMFDLGNWNPFFPSDVLGGKKYATCLQMLQYPYSRGSIHIPPGSPSSAADKPRIDPKYYEGPHGELDLDVMTHCAMFADKIAKTKPLANITRAACSTSRSDKFRSHARMGRQHDHH